MDDKVRYEELITRYLSGEASKDESILIEEWINSSAQNAQLFAELCHVWSLVKAKSSIDKIDLDYEWKQLTNNISSLQAKVVPIQKHLHDEATTELKPKQKSGIYNSLLKVLAAASILLVIGFGWSKLSKSSSESLSIDEVSNVDDKIKDTLFALVRQQKNYTGKTKRILLNDGSVVILSDSSEISYDENFIANKRDLVLKGMANFSVAKDTIRPFTVFSGAISITALGTKFSVDAYGRNRNIVVRLYEGKVVVRSNGKANIKLTAPVYLSPGQELIYNKETGTAKVRLFLPGKPSKKEAIKKDYPSDNPSIPSSKEGSWYMFNNQSLSEVFEQLEEMYQVEIVYSKSDVERMYFIGKFDKSHSIESILNQICLLNNLKVTKRNNQFIINR